MKFDNFLELQKEAQSVEPKTIDELYNNNLDRIVADASLVDIISQQDLRELEMMGFSVTKFTEENQLGTFGIDEFKSARELYRSTQLKLRNDSKETIYRIQRHFHSGFGIISKAPTKLSQEEIAGHAFKNTNTHTQAISIYSATENKWSEPVLVPSGSHITQSLTSTNQYAQGCFEGMVAMSNHQGEIVTFRPFDNARRLQISCRGLCIPEVPTEYFMHAITGAVNSNISYLPEYKSNAKLYIRPYVKGIDGGSGVASAENFVFGVDVFPFGDYFSGPDSTVDLVSIQNTRRSTPGGVGSLKYIGNYARTMLHKRQAKQGLIEGYDGKKFNDVFYMGDHFHESINGEIIAQEVLEEDAAGNLIFYKNEGIIYTPMLSRETILPGFTRNSVLEIARHKGYEVIETHMPFEMIKEMDGAFLVGSAAGAVRINSMSYLGQTIEFSNHPQDTKLFYETYNNLYALRRNDTSGFADSEIIRNYPFVIGKVNS